MNTPFCALSLALAILVTLSPSPAGAADKENPKSIYDYELVDIEGKKTSLVAYRNKALLIVNVASECGATPQYAGLVELQKKYAARGLVVLGFPVNDFGAQEPGTEEQIKKFCSSQYGVNFPMFSKISVEGAKAHPLFNHLMKAANPDFTGPIQWNFEKFLVSGDGLLLRRFRTGTEPDSPELINSLDSAVKSLSSDEAGGCRDC